MSSIGARGWYRSLERITHLRFKKAAPKGRIPSTLCCVLVVGGVLATGRTRQMHLFLKSGLAVGHQIGLELRE